MSNNNLTIQSHIFSTQNILTDPFLTLLPKSYKNFFFFFKLITYKKLGWGDGVSLSSSLMIRLHNTLCSFGNTDVNGVWPLGEQRYGNREIFQGQNDYFTSQH